MKAVELVKIVKIRPIGMDKPTRSKEATEVPDPVPLLRSLGARRGKIPFPNAKLRVAVAASQNGVSLCTIGRAA